MTTDEMLKVESIVAEIERLRAQNAELKEVRHNLEVRLNSEIRGCGAEIERLRAQNAELRAVLPDLLDHYLNCYDGNMDALAHRARDALEGK